MKVCTIYGTRPELIRLSLILPKLDDLCDHVTIHTGQNYDPNLSEVFMKELDIREPNYYLNAVGSFGKQIAVMVPLLESILLNEKPDAFLVLGDTNSSLGAIVAKRLGIRVFHMEAGNRCFDDKVPEEVNRRIIDHCTDIHLPYTERSRQNLLDEGIHSSKIYVTGNPIKEVLDGVAIEIDASNILYKLDLTPDKYFLVTLHRQENVDDPERLTKFVEALEETTDKYEIPIIWSVHPRTRKRLESFKLSENIKLVEPLGLFDFVKLELEAYCVLTDSGTVQEECAIFGVPCVTLRDTTERPETLETGSNFIAGCETDAILRGIKATTSFRIGTPPVEYIVEQVSDTVCKIVLSYYG